MRLKALQASEALPEPVPEAPRAPTANAAAELAHDGDSKPLQGASDPSSDPLGSSAAAAEHPAAQQQPLDLPEAANRPDAQGTGAAVKPEPAPAQNMLHQPPQQAAAEAGSGGIACAAAEADPHSLMQRISGLRQELLELLGDVEGDVRPVWGSPARMKALRTFLHAAHSPQVSFQSTRSPCVAGSSIAAVALGVYSARDGKVLMLSQQPV